MVVLKHKSQSKFIEIDDDIFPGLLTGKFYCFIHYDTWGSVIQDLETTIAEYRFPTECKTSSRILPFLSGANPALYNRIQFY